jgi:hypothetical protein
MRSLKTLIAAAAITTLGIGVPAVLASTASAAVTPVIYNYASGWHNAAVRPHWIVIGQGGSPMAHPWWWNTWNSTVAKSTGTLWWTTASRTARWARKATTTCTSPSRA